jgi:hypothetical protein
MHLVIDTHTGATVARYVCVKRARRRRDALDLKYGAVRYAVRST